MNTYFFISIIVFIVTMRIFIKSKHSNDKKTSLPKKIGICILISLIAPAIIMGALDFLKIGRIAHGE